jgi:hypothetical protein
VARMKCRFSTYQEIEEEFLRSCQHLDLIPKSEG